MHTLEKQLELYYQVRAAGYLTNFNDINEMTEEEVVAMIND